MCTMPSYDDLKNLYLQGWTYQALAQRYHIAKSTVARLIKDGALASGEWPLTPDLTRAERIRRAQMGRFNAELVDSSMLVTQLRIRLAEYNGSCNGFCKRHGLRPTTVGELLRGEKPKITHQLAERLRRALAEETTTPSPSC